MELYTMQYVLALAEYKKFSLAAQACYIGQPALSQQIAKLEKELGVALFVRNAHTVVLTEAGKEFVLRAKQILQNVGALEAEMNQFAGLRKGRLNIGVITSLQCIDFGGMLSSFFVNYPKIDANIIQSGTHDLLNKLGERTLDVAFLNHPVSNLPTSVEFYKLGEDHYSLAVPKSHPLAKRSCVRLAELKDERFIFHQTGQVAFQLCLRACRDAGFEPKIRPSACIWYREIWGSPFSPRRSSATGILTSLLRFASMSRFSRRWASRGAETATPRWWIRW